MLEMRDCKNISEISLYKLQNNCMFFRSAISLHHKSVIHELQAVPVSIAQPNDDSLCELIFTGYARISNRRGNEENKGSRKQKKGNKTRADKKRRKRARHFA